MAHSPDESSARPPRPFADATGLATIPDWLRALDCPAALLTTPGDSLIPNPALSSVLARANGLDGSRGDLAMPEVFTCVEGDCKQAAQLMADLRQVMHGRLDSITSSTTLAGQRSESWRVTGIRLGTQPPCPVLLTWVREPGDADARPTAAPALTRRMREALEREEFSLVYQPLLSCTTGRITGAEALLRWQHPTQGQLAPVSFLPELESSGLIKEVGAWALIKACRDIADLPPNEIDGRPLLAVNLSGQQIGSDDLVATVSRALSESGLPADRLELELTEMVLMDQSGRAEAVLGELRALGVGIAIDDFGTGYSSLSNLRRFPITSVKIDRSFISHIVDQQQSLSIVRAVIGMARSLHLRTTAEGVETEAQLGILVANGCDEIQGYYFSPPVGLDTLHAMWLESRRLKSSMIGRDPHSKVLLIVDDEPNVRHALRRALRRAPYSVLFAATGAEALQLMGENPVDVVLSDQRMPEMTGVELLRRVKAIHPDTIRLVLSGFTDLQSVTEAINQGAVYKFLTKPWDDRLLLANLDEAFRQKALIDENRRLLAGAHGAAARSLHEAGGGPCAAIPLKAAPPQHPTSACHELGSP